MRRPGGFTVLAPFVAILSSVVVYYAFGYATGREGIVERGDFPEPDGITIPIWPWTIPVRYQPLPTLGLLCALCGVTGLVTAGAMWWMSRWAFPLSIAWGAAGFALLIGQALVLPVYDSVWMAVLVAVAQAGFFLWFCTYVRQVVIQPFRPEPLDDW
jgi:hypothetical protein